MNQTEYDEARSELVEEINSKAAERERLEEQHGEVWDTHELQKNFEVLGFQAPFCVVRRKRDGVLGSLAFQHTPRFYFGFTAD